MATLLNSSNTLQCCQHRNAAKRNTPRACCQLKHGTQMHSSTRARHHQQQHQEHASFPLPLATALTTWSTLGVVFSAAADAHAGDAAVPEASAAAAAASAAVDATSAYVPGPVEVGWQIWFAAIVSTIPFVIGAYEFGKRILIQRRCQVCAGRGLVMRGAYPRKCPECGGFFPWISWRMFLSANARPGNGGPLLQPKGQTSVFYSVPSASADARQQQSVQQQSRQDAADFRLPGVGKPVSEEVAVSSSNECKSSASGGGD